MGKVLTPVKRWLTFHLVKVASQLDGELFMRLCEVAVYAQYKDKIEYVKEALQDVMRLEQEHYYDNQEVNYNDTDSNTTHNKHKLH